MHTLSLYISLRFSGKGTNFITYLQKLPSEHFYIQTIYNTKKLVENYLKKKIGNTDIK